MLRNLRHILPRSCAGVQTKLIASSVPSKKCLRCSLHSVPWHKQAAMNTAVRTFSTQDTKDPPPPEDGELSELLRQLSTAEHMSEIANQSDADFFNEDQEVEKNTMTDSLPGHSIRGILVPTRETHTAIIDGQRYDQLPIAHVHASYQNTIILITDHTGAKEVGRSSGGRVGFKNAKKKTAVAAQAAGLAAGQVAVSKGVTHIRVAFNGIGKGRLAACNGIEESGIQIVSLTDVSGINNDSLFSKKRRRL